MAVEAETAAAGAELACGLCGGERGGEHAKGKAERRKDYDEE